MAQEPLSTGSVYDLLYVDSRRLASYLAQIDPNGTLTGLKLTASGTEKKTTTGRIGIPGTGAEMAHEGFASEGVERQFDPIWVIPITTLDQLDELGFIHRSLQIPVGSLTLVRGVLRLIDIRMLKEMWPGIGKMLTEQSAPSGNRKERRSSSVSKSQASAASPLAGVFELVRHLPHALELHMMTQSGTAWTTLSPECLLSNAEDIALKYGTAIEGEWHMLAVVDAQPRPIEWLEEPWGSTTASAVPTACAKLLSAIREQFGRPADAYGVTPLMIFRSLGRPE